MPRPASLLLIAVCAASLAGCLTPRLRPTPSRAILDARAHRNTPPPAALCTALTSPVSVGFGFDNATLGDLDNEALESAIFQLGCHPDATALIVGQPDTHGTDADKQKLAQARIQAVADHLTAHGVSAARLRTQVRGAVPAGDARQLVILAEGRRW